MTMQMPKPGADHQKLQKIVGNWTGTEIVHPSPFDPKGGVAIGRVLNRLALDGFAVVQDYEHERGGIVAFRGHGIFWWDAVRKAYVLSWFDSMGQPPNDFSGPFDGNVMTLTTVSSTTVQMQGLARATFDFNRRDGYAYKLEVSPDGKQWFPSISGEYKRQI